MTTYDANNSTNSPSSAVSTETHYSSVLAPPSSSRPKKLSNVNLLRHVIYTYYDPVIDEYGVFYLAPKQPGLARLMEPELISPELKRLAADMENRDVSDQHVKDVLQILRAGWAPCMSVGNGRTWVGMEQGERYLFVNGTLMVLEKGCENMLLARTPVLCWQPVNCRTYVTNQIQGPGAWDVIQIKRLADHLPMPMNRELLVFAFMVLTLMTERDQLVLELTGESKSGTTRLVRAIKRLVDPCVNDELIRQPLMSVKDCDAHAWHHHVLALDNVDTQLPEAVQRRMFDFLSDARLDWRPSRREPWVSFVMSRRTFLISASDPVVTQRELRERTLSLEMTPPLDATTSHPYAPDEIGRPRGMTDYDWALIQTALLALLAKAHAALEYTKLDRQVPEDWADFCRVGVIVSKALYGNDADFWTQYEAYHHERQCEVIEEEPVAYAIVQYFQKTKEQGKIEKPAGSWLRELEHYRPEWATDRDWPQKPRGVGAAFKRAASLLRSHGFVCHSNGKRGSLCRWSIGPVSVATRHY
nr:hypothetical protein [uncultured Halomonas sp.]